MQFASSLHRVGLGKQVLRMAGEHAEQKAGECEGIEMALVHRTIKSYLKMQPSIIADIFADLLHPFCYWRHVDCTPPLLTLPPPNR